MTDIIDRLKRGHQGSGIGPLDCHDAVQEIEQLQKALLRIDAINDNPAHFNFEINDVCNAILRPHLTQQFTKTEERMPTCELCGEPMPQDEEMFRYHGFSGPCPKSPIASPEPEPFSRTLQRQLKQERIQRNLRDST